MSVPYHVRKRQKLEAAIHAAVTTRLQQLAADPIYLAAPLDGQVRNTERKRLLRQVRAEYPEATVSMLQRVIAQVAHDLAHCSKKD